MIQNSLYNLIEYTGDGQYIMVDEISGNSYGIDMLPPGSQEWFIWLASLGYFHFKGKAGHFMARHEEKKQDNAPAYFNWYAYRKVNGRLHKLYLGRTNDLTMEQLEHVARNLQAAALGSNA
jgi:hypothetical protein